MRVLPAIGSSLQAALRNVSTQWADRVVSDPGNHGDVTESGGVLTFELDASWTVTGGDPGDGISVAFPLLDVANQRVTGDKAYILFVSVFIETPRPVVANDVKFAVSLGNNSDPDAATVELACLGIEWNSGVANPRAFSGFVENDTYAGVTNATGNAALVGGHGQFNRAGDGGGTGCVVVGDLVGLDVNNDQLNGSFAGLNTTSTTNRPDSFGNGDLWLLVHGYSINAGVGSARTIKATVKYAAVQVAYA